MFSDFDLEGIVTPIDVNKLRRLLNGTGYDPMKAQELIKGFEEGFDIGYRGPSKRKNMSSNIPLRIGTEIDLWNKIMKEVKLSRVAGPYDTIPYSDTYMQSPIGLVPKAGGQTRLIFHLSYDFGDRWEDKSLNFHTPKDLRKVTYCDLDYAIKTCLHLGEELLAENSHQLVKIFYSKTDVRAAFRLLPLLVRQRKFLVMKARNPVTKKYVCFVEKNVSFGASRSCALFQSFSDSLKHIIEHITGRYFTVTNYLDNFLFVDSSQQGCNSMVRNFLAMCRYIGCPIAEEKTEWAENMVVFLGILLNGKTWTLSLPAEKVFKAQEILNWAIDKKCVTIHFVQRITGILNFLNKAIVPGRVFTRGMYEKLKTTDKKGRKLKQHHHVALGNDFIRDCKVWKSFLSNLHSQAGLCRPFVDIRNGKMPEYSIYTRTQVPINDWGVEVFLAEIGLCTVGMQSSLQNMSPA